MSFFLFDNHTKEEQANSIAAYLPNDETFLAKRISGKNLRNLILAFSNQFVEFEQTLNIYTNQLGPLEATYLLTEWERMVGIPDQCFSGTGTISERQRDVLVKLASLSVQTNQDFVALADIFGVDVEITAGTDFDLFFPAPFPIQFIGDLADSKFVVMVKFLTPSPLSGLIECLFSQLIPANCVLTVIQVTP